MKRLVFSILIPAYSILPCPAHTFEWTPEKPDTLMGKYEKRIYNYHKRGHNLIPTHTVLQYAGSVGAVSIGAGWN